MLRFKSKKHKQHFIDQQIYHTIISLIILIISLIIGVIGYHILLNYGYIDSFYNASMILTGMGPVGTVTTESAKFFVSCYAIYSGVIFLSITAFLVTPIFGNILHKLQQEIKDILEE